MGTILLVVAILVALNAVFVGIEFAMVGARKPRVEAMVHAGSTTARVLLEQIAHPRALDRIVSAGQIGITASSLVLGAYGQDRLADAIAPTLALAGLPATIAPNVAMAAVLLLLTMLQVLFGELVPKAVAMRYPETMALVLVHPARAFLKATHWLVEGLSFVARHILAWLKVPLDYHRHVHSPEEIEVLINQGREKGVLDAEEHRRLRRVLRFSERRVREVMVPRVRIHGISNRVSRQELEREAADAVYTRLPVYAQSLDHIVGIVHVKDVFIALAQGRSPDVNSLLRPVPGIPSGMPLQDVLDRLRTEKAQMAVVLDEFGGTAGVVTIEDLVEEVMGEVQDEFDQETPPIEALPDGTVRVHGDLSLADLAEHFEVPGSELEVHTVAGVVMHHLGRAPRRGDRARWDGLELEVEDIQGSLIKRVLARRASAGEAQPDHA